VLKISSIAAFEYPGCPTFVVYLSAIAVDVERLHFFDPETGLSVDAETEVPAA
jgi:hypothetical protein